RYELYSSKIYDDVRLVFAPEDAMGFFGGDPDNFTFPRFDLDAAFFRAYESDGRPATPRAFLKWNPAGPTDGATVFVSGRPVATERMLTVAQLATLRDVVYPSRLDTW